MYYAILQVLFRSNSLKMMNNNDPLDFVILKASDQIHSISDCHDVGAKILKRYLRLRLYIDATQLKNCCEILYFHHCRSHF